MFHRVLIIATEWSSHHGGVSSFNRAFCRETARLGHVVACLVARASDNEVSDAAAAGVQLFFHRTSLDGLSDRERLCLPGAIPNDFAPTVIVGHGHVSGPAAKALQSSVFPTAKRIHFFHTSPFGIEQHKDANTATGFSMRATKKEELERRLGVSADAIVTVGPRLDSEWRTNLNGAFHRIHQVVPGITERGDALEPPPANQCLILGRMEDWKLKGLDIAARAVALLQSNDGERRLRPVLVLVVRGVEPESVGVIEGQLKAMCGPQLQVRVKPYTADAEALLQDLRSAAVVMMPSREEGFGLVGLEALAAGVPLLISDRSGLGDLLTDRGDRDGVVTMVTNDDDVDVKVWSEAIARVLLHKADSFAQARALASRIQEARYFETTVAPIFNGLEAEEQPPPIPPASTPDGPATLQAIAKISAPAAILAAFAELETDLRLTAATGARYSAPLTLVNELVGSGRLSEASAALIARLAKFRKETIHRQTAATEC